MGAEIVGEYVDLIGNHDSMSSIRAKPPEIRDRRLLKVKGTTKQEFFILSCCLHQIGQCKISPSSPDRG